MFKRREVENESYEKDGIIIGCFYELVNFIEVMKVFNNDFWEIRVNCRKYKVGCKMCYSSNKGNVTSFKLMSLYLWIIFFLNEWKNLF